MIDAIQYAYYLKALNPSEEIVLFDLAENIGLNVQAFKKDLNSSRVNNSLIIEIEFSKDDANKRLPIFGIIKK